jgi:hypothetical protein
MRILDKSRVLRVLNHPHAVADRLAIWSKEARRNGNPDRADRLLLAAWEAYDLPSVADLLGRQTIVTEISSSLSKTSSVPVTRRPTGH